MPILPKLPGLHGVVERGHTSLTLFLHILPLQGREFSSQKSAFQKDHVERLPTVSTTMQISMFLEDGKTGAM